MFCFVLVLAAARIAPVINNVQRESRIKTIYASLGLDNSYIPNSSNIFGDKRIYNDDTTKTRASSVTFVRPENVDETVSDLTGRIEKAGFANIGQLYAGSASRQYHFKSAKGEYIRISVSSKPRDDVIENRFLMKQPLSSDEFTMDASAGPSNVSIKVNLDTDSD